MPMCLCLMFAFIFLTRKFDETFFAEDEAMMADHRIQYWRHERVVAARGETSYNPLPFFVTAKDDDNGSFRRRELEHGSMEHLRREACGCGAAIVTRRRQKCFVGSPPLAVSEACAPRRRQSHPPADAGQG